MRIRLAAASLLALAACQPETKPASETAATTPEPTLEELGQDDPSVPFEPAAVGPPRTYEAMSKTAMSFTPGVLTLTPTPQASPNLPSGAVFAFGIGYTLKTTSMPGGAEQGARPFDFKPFIIDPSGTPIDVSKIEMYSVDEENVPQNAPNGGFCDRTSFLATYTVRSPGAEDMTIVAFSGDVWPPKDASVLCGTFTYSNVH